MSTHSITVIHDGDQPIVQMYKQFDGYPSGHGAELAAFLDGMAIINGIPMEIPKKAANGAGCLAAQMVAHFKEGIGGIYLEAIGPNVYVDYEYRIIVNESDLQVAVADAYDGVVLFFGNVKDFGVFCRDHKD